MQPANPFYPETVLGIKNSPLTSVIGRMTKEIRISRIKNVCSMIWVRAWWKTLLMGTMCAFLPMGKRVVEKRTQ